MDLGIPATTTEQRFLVGMVQFYRYMWPIQSHVLAPLIQGASSHKGRKILQNKALESSLKELNRMVSSYILLSYPEWKMIFTVHTDASDKQLGAVIIHNNKPIAFFSRRLIKPQSNYTTTDKELLVIVGLIKQFRRILFSYEINIFSENKTMFYAATLSESHRVVRWRIILGQFGPNIQHISRIDKIVSDTLIIFLSTPINKREPCTRKTQCRANELFAPGRVENNE